MIDDHNQKIALGLTVAFPVLGGIALGLRLWGRKLSRLSYGWDDYLIIVAYALIIGQAVTSWFFIKTNYVGIHIWDVPKDRDFRTGNIWSYANMFVYNPTLAFVKASVLLFLSRLEAHSRTIRWLIWTTFAINLGHLISVALVVIFQCWPIELNFDYSLINQGKCVNQGKFYITASAIAILTDFMVLSIPILISRKLHLPVRRKIAVVIILSLGLLATLVGIWRLAIFVDTFYGNSLGENPDNTYSIGFCISFIESNLALITASVPSMKTVFNKYCPCILGSSERELESPNGARVYQSTAIATPRIVQLQTMSGGDNAFETDRAPQQRLTDVLNGGKTKFSRSIKELSGHDEEKAVRGVDMNKWDGYR
ncbi:hypothetical protein AJ79_06145 [Helicocarpus griseus UAMH5409]|uniref:Rhodopsin domain-containing protein n=1 Tax=Helicocarpus griseus UAMH5409 TaxID=1447875 RepID=A0A2B7XH00_9EURO|nr:hypothetical protein AJ79_06145 [Helicocarpus griseus UAMH5409]